MAFQAGNGNFEGKLHDLELCHVPLIVISDINCKSVHSAGAC